MSIISQKVTGIIIEELGVDDVEVMPDVSLTEDLGADGADMAEIIKALESEFEITIPSEDATSLTTVKDIIAYIEDHAET